MGICQSNAFQLGPRNNQPDSNLHSWLWLGIWYSVASTQRNHRRERRGDSTIPTVQGSPEQPETEGIFFHDSGTRFAIIFLGHPAVLHSLALSGTLRKIK